MLLGQERIDEDGIAFAINKRDGIRDPSKIFLAGRQAVGGASALLGQNLPVQVRHNLLLFNLAFSTSRHPTSASVGPERNGLKTKKVGRRMQNVGDASLFRDLKTCEGWLTAVPALVRPVKLADVMRRSLAALTQERRSASP